MDACVRAVLFLVLLAGLGRAEGEVGAQEKKAKRGGGGVVLILNKSGNTLSILDRTSGLPLKTLPTDAGPHEIAVSPDGKTAVACNYGVRGQAGRTLTVYDIVKFQKTSTIELGDYRRPHGIAFLPDGARVVVTAEASRALLVVDVKSGKVEKAVDTGARLSHMVALGPKGKRAYVANIMSHSMTAIDLEKGEVIKQVPTGRGAEGIAVRPCGAEIWVTNRAADTISVVDATKLKVVAQIPCPRFPIRIAMAADGKHALVSCALSADVAVLDVAARKVIKRVTMRVEELEKGDRGTMFGRRRGPMPIGIVLAPDGRHAFVANGGYDRLAVIDLKTFKVIARYETGREPDGLAFSSRSLSLK